VIFLEDLRLLRLNKLPSAGNVFETEGNNLKKMAQFLRVATYSTLAILSQTHLLYTSSGTLQ